MHDSLNESKAHSPRLSLVIPAYNEAEVIGKAIDEAAEALSALGRDFEILIVDDGCTDATPDIVAESMLKHSCVRLIQHSSNQGYGAALRSGFAAAKFELIGFTDADCQFDLNELDRFLLLAQNYDAVCGYRIDRKDSRLRCLYSLAYNKLVRLLLGIRIRDVDCALKVFHRDLLQQTKIQSDGFLVNSDLLTQIDAAGGSIVEVGVSHRPRAAGESTVSAWHIPGVLVSLIRFWWNEIQFPRHESGSSTQISRLEQRRTNLVQWAVIAAVVIFLFTNLSYPLIDRDETRYAEIPREMLVTGEWDLPTLNFQTYYDKPPLLYWLVASSYSVFGVHEWSARLIPALFAFGTFLLVTWFARRHFGPRLGLAAGIVLMLTGGFAFFSRYLLLDGVLTFFTAVSMFAGFESVHGRQSKGVHLGWWLTASVACGLGFLTKGPISLVLLLPVVVAYSSLTQNAARISLVNLVGLLAIVGTIALPWMVAVSLRDPTFLWEFFVNHNVRRFAGQYHDRPIWFFVPVLLAAGFPWTLMTIPFVRHFVTRVHSVRQSRPSVTGFLCLWALWMFVFFSASRCKLPTYLLPTAPAFALLLSTYLDRILSQNRNGDVWEKMARTWSAGLATTFSVVLGIGLIVYIVSAQTVSTIEVSVWVLLTGLLAFSGVVATALRNHHRSNWGLAASLNLLVVIILLHAAVPIYSRSQSIFSRSSGTVSELRLSGVEPIATIGHEFSEVPFYLDREDVFHFPSRDDRGLTRYAQAHPDGLLVAEKSILVGDLQSQMPPGIRLQSLMIRGPARLLRLSRKQPTMTASQQLETVQRDESREISAGDAFTPQVVTSSTTLSTN